MSRVLVLNETDVRDLLKMADCITLMRDTLKALADGELHQPLRYAVSPPKAGGALALMPAYRDGTSPTFGLKAICVFPENPSRGLDTHLGAVLLFKGQTGEPYALVNASAITAIRTAAVSAVATQLLARADASELAVIGAGVQARSHLDAITQVRPLRRARIVGRSAERVRDTVRWANERYSFPVLPCESVQDALREADLIVTATSSHSALVKGAWVQPGTHLNVVGSSSPNHREVDGSTMAAASLFVDRTESTASEAGDYLLAVAEGAIEENHIRAELGEVLTGRHPGRTSTSEITLFKSLGLAVEDLAAAEHVHRTALEQGRGRWVDL